MLESLRERDRSVGELVTEIDICQPGISKQLRILHGAGMVTVRREGRQRIYSLRAAPLKEASAWLSYYEQHWDESLDTLGSLLDERQKRRKARR